MRSFRLLALLLLAILASSACDCDDGVSDRCDCEPSITFLSPTGGALSEFNDTNAAELGIQYPVRVQTRCIPEGTQLAFNNDKSPEEMVLNQVVIDDVATGMGHIEFDDQTFIEGINRICVRGGAEIVMNEDGSQDCTTRAVLDLEVCKDVVVELGVPACRFDRPTDGVTLTSADDSSANDGFQSDVVVVCKGINDGEVVQLILNGRQPIEGVLAFESVSFEDVDLGEGSNLLRAETEDTAGHPVVAEIGVTVDTGACVARLLPADGTQFQPADDQDPAVEGLQTVLTAETNASGLLACADGSSVSLYLNGSLYHQDVLTSGSIGFLVTLPEGATEAYVLIEESGADARIGQSLPNNYTVCGESSIAITAPRADPECASAITDAADRDGDTAGIQIAVSGSSAGFAQASDLWLEVDGQVVTDAFGENLRPVLFEAGGDFEFQWVTFLQSRSYDIAVKGMDLCTGEELEAIHQVCAFTEQVTCEVIAPANESILRALDDLDSDPDTDLQYNALVQTANVPDGWTFDLYLGGEQLPLRDLILSDNAWTAEVTFTDGLDKQVQCVLQDGTVSPVNTIWVDAHPPTIDITSPGEGEPFDGYDQEVCMDVDGAEVGQLVTVTVTNAVGSTDFSASLNGASICIDVTLGDGANALVASVTDLAGNLATSSTINVTVTACIAAPTVAFIDPDGSLTQPVSVPTAGLAYVEVSATEVASSAALTLDVYAGTVLTQSLNNPQPTNGNYVFSDVNFVNGAMTLRLTAINSCGTTVEDLEVFVGDPNAPSIVLTDPLNDSCTSATTISASANTTNAAGEFCAFCIRAESATVLPECTMTTMGFWSIGQVDASGVCTSQSAADFPAEGDYQIWASVGNTISTTTSAAIVVINDITAPVPSFVTPVDGGSFNAATIDTDPGTLGLQVAIDLAADVREGRGTITLNGTDGILDDPIPTFANGHIILQQVTLDEGQKTLDAEICDCAGNCGTVGPISVLVDLLVPEMFAIPSPASMLGASGDSAAAVPGFQHAVTCQFEPDTVEAGDQLCLSVSLNAGTYNQAESLGVAVPCQTLTAAQLSEYTFINIDMLPAADSAGDVSVRCELSDTAGNTDNLIKATYINILSPAVSVTRPDDGDDLNNAYDMCGDDSSFETQVDVQVSNIEAGDTLIVCICESNGVGGCLNDDAGRCGQDGRGATFTPGSVSGSGSVVLSCVPMPQGDVVLVAFAENIPGQGVY
ncbi:MAG: hypothetical protein JRF33_07800, partial [Deltaproteobacteria bacterium]|nr:hypothetical protein [Deltaproteobacteria bacterium]